MKKSKDNTAAPSLPQFITEPIRRALIMQALAAEAYDDAICAALLSTLKGKGLAEGDWMVVRDSKDNPLCQVCWAGDEVYLRPDREGGEVPYNEDVYAALLGETTEVLDREFEDAKRHASAYSKLELVYD